MENRKLSGVIAIAAEQNIKERDYWRQKLATSSEELLKSSFPVDFNQSESSLGVSVSKETHGFNVPGELTAGLMRMSNNADPRLHMILTAGLMLMLHKYLDRNDILIGMPVFRAQMEGEFINTVLPLRQTVNGDMSFKDLLLAVRSMIVEADAHQDYPVEALPRLLGLSYGEGEAFPLLDTALLLENIQDIGYLERIDFSMVFSFNRTENGIDGQIHYNPGMYRESTVRRLTRHYFQLLGQALSDVNAPVSGIEVMTKEEMNQILVDFNRTSGEFPMDRTAHQLFEEQVERTPENIAVTINGESFTYRELNVRSNQLARLIRQKGIGVDDIVGIMVHYSLEMITGILAILKAGGAYLPISPDTPPKRIHTLLRDSGASLVLTTNDITRELSFIHLQDFEWAPVQPYASPPRSQVENLDMLQIPDRSLIDYEKYRANIGQAMVKNSITIHMSRGCVYNCAYCFKIWSKKYILRSAENIFNEIKLYYDMGIRRFAFVDDLPNINVEVSSNVFQMIIDHGMTVHLHFPNGIRGDILTPDYIDLMVAAGTITMDLALETTSPRLQKLVRKNLNLKKLEENIKYITENHPHVILEMQIIHGIPSETEEEARASLDFIKSIKWVHFPYIHILNIYPQSDMADIAVAHGISREAIARSADLAYHELPETLPFSQAFTHQYQSEFLNEYFLDRERLLTVLPYQMRVLTEDELIQKYNSYLPVEITDFSQLLDYAGLTRDQIAGEFLPEDYGFVPGFDEKLRAHFSPLREVPAQDALRVLMLDLTQFFTHETGIMYDVVEPPLGALYVMNHLNRTFGSRINGKIAKSRIDFDSYDALKLLIDQFKPDIIGVRSMNFYKDFFHKAVSLIRHWGIEAPIIAGGPYATSNYPTMLKDKHIDLAVVGEGEITFAEVVAAILNNNHRMPAEDVLKTIPGVAFVEKKDREQLMRQNRDILLMDRVGEALSNQSGENLATINAPGDLAYIIYTSGSTGVPKGVLVQHNNLVNQMAGLQRDFELDASRHYLLLAAFTFDVSVMHIFSPLTTGARLFLIDEETRKDSTKLWKFIYDNKIDILNIVPTFMEALLESIEAGKIGFKYLFVGGDVFRPHLLGRLRETFQVDEIINIYGPTETTINADMYRCGTDTPPGDALPIGKPLMNYTAYILNSENRLVPIGVTGELLIGGAGVTRGYLNRPELTAQKFIRHGKTRTDTDKKDLLIGIGTVDSQSNPSHLSHRSYRTGDLARWLPDGNIQFMGRIDHQVKVRGFRIELGEIEKRLTGHESVRDAVVIARYDEIQDTRFLCAYIVPTVSGCTAGLKQYLARELPSYMIPAHFIEINKIPLSSSGKVDKNALPDPGTVELTGVYEAPGTDLERQLMPIWAEVLGFETDKLSVTANFFNLGGHSLKATVLLARIHKELQIKVPMVELFGSPTIRTLARTIEGLTVERFAEVEPVEVRGFYPLSSAQQRLFLLQQMEPESTAYNMPIVFPIDADTDLQRMETVFNRLTDRHESLRTSFHMMDEDAVQVVHERVELGIEAVQPGMGNDGLSAVKKGFIRPFDLSSAPLIRVGLMNRPGDVSLLCIDMHHIITDAASHEVLENEFYKLYAGVTLPPLRLQYRDYAVWQNSPQQKDAVAEQATYWLGAFSGELPRMDLPYDFPRPEIKQYEGNTVGFTLEPDDYRYLTELGKKSGSTLFMVLMAAYSILLSKLSGLEDIIIGTHVAGRRHADLQNIIGMFVNTLPMRYHPGSAKTFTGFLAEVKALTLEAFENQEYPFEDMVDRLAVPRDTGRNPVFDVSFNLVNRDDSNPNGSDKPEHVESIAKFDLNLTALDHGNRLSLSFEYSTALFKPATIDRFIGYFKRIVTTVCGSPATLISNIDMLSVEEKQLLMVDFNQTDAEYPVGKTIHQLFSERAAAFPENIAVGAGVGEADLSFTYRQLDEKSNDCVRFLREQGIQPGMVVGIMVERSVEMIVGIMGILKAGCAYLPIDPNAPQARMDFMTADSNAWFVLTMAHLREIAASENAGESLEDDMDCSADHAAYVIYTSGTTGKPKGVMIAHRNVLNLVEGLKKEIYSNYSGFLNVCIVAPYVFDASVQQIFGALLLGHALYVVPESTRLEGGELLHYFQAHKIDICDGTPTHLRILAEIMDEATPPLPVKHFIIGGEALPTSVVETFLSKCATHSTQSLPRITNVYGPTECTVDSSFHNISTGESPFAVNGIPNILIGKPLANCKIFILSKTGQCQPTGTAGELCIAGDGVGMGYLNRPELTAKKFICQTSQKEHLPLLGVPRGAVPWSAGRPPEGPPEASKIYRTGDLARWLPDGNIEFLGRMDTQVKLRGFRIELGEIESQLSEHDQVKEAVVILRTDSNSDQYLCGFVVPSDSAAPLFETLDTMTGQLSVYLSEVLPGYMVPTYFVKLDKVPLTANGKTDRKTLSLMEIPGRELRHETYCAPRNAMEEKLVDLWAGVLVIDRENIGIDDNFFTLGGHSLKVTILSARIHKTFDVKIPLIEIFRSPTIRGIAAYMNLADRKIHDDVSAVEKQEYYPLSPAQKRLYIIQQIDPAGTRYNMPYVFPLEREYHRDQLETAFKQLIARHESLRTSFHMMGDTPVQRVHDPEETEFHIDYREAGTDTLEMDIPFDLTRAPLLRATVLEADEGIHFLSVNMHHIISDGVSQGILEKDFTSLYMGETLEPLPLQYKDYAVRQAGTVGQEAVRKQEAYWLETFAGPLPVLQLPTDYARPLTQGVEGRQLRFFIDSKTTTALKSLASTRDATLYMVLLACLDILLARLSGQTDIIVGTPAAGRTHTDLQEIIGMFVGTLSMRNFPEPEKTIGQFLTEVKEQTLAAYENQEYPFEELVDKVSIQRDAERNPLFDVMFNFLNIYDAADQPALDESLLDNIEDLGEQQANFDLTFQAMEMEDLLVFTLTYYRLLFNRDTVERFIAYFEKIISIAATAPETVIGAIDIIGENEKETILYHFNDTAVDYPSDTVIHALFENQVEKTPGNLAVSGLTGSNETPGHPISLTYRQLNNRVDHAARLLRQKGIGTGTIAALLTMQTPAMVVGILAILKAGGAYLPIDPSYPGERIAFMLNDSCARVLLTQKKLSETMGEYFHHDIPVFLEDLMMVDDPVPHVINPMDALETPGSSPADAAYVIYTSGTTGQPKGMVIAHHSLNNLCHWHNRNYEVTTADRATKYAGIGFDASVWEMFPYLVAGASLHIVPDEIKADIPRLSGFIHDNGITIAFFPPQVCEQLMPELGDHSPLRLMLSGGDKLRRFRDVPYRLVNNYGPTENTVVSTCFTVDTSAGYGDIPIGKPIDNTRLYILGNDNQVQPIGVAGELCISGVGLAMGYLNQPELTDQCFVSNGSHPSDSSHRSHRSYHTGDLARWRADGNVEFLGRVDRQVKIRGFRIELTEIEARLLQHQSIKEAVVLERLRDDGETYLSAFIVTGNVAGNVTDNEAGVGTTELSSGILRQYLGRKLPDYMIPANFTIVKHIPLTANGKTDRNALMRMEISVAQSREDDYTAPRNETEEILAGVWAVVLELKKTRIGIDDNFFQLGGHSLKATVLTARIHKALDVKIPVGEIFRTPTIRGIGDYIKKSESNVHYSIPAVEKKEYYPLSSAQKRMFLLNRMKGDDTSDNTPSVLTIDGDLDMFRFEAAIKALIQRHEVLRTSFLLLEDEPGQRVVTDVPFNVEHYTIKNSNTGQQNVQTVIQQFIRPFDLAQAPLFRVALVKPAEIDGQTNPHLLMYDMHHIISDGTSSRIFASDFLMLYSGVPLQALRIQYKDFAQWQNSMTVSETVAKQEDYWLKRFSPQSPVPVLNMPTDFPRPEIQSFEGKSMRFRIEGETAEKLKQLVIDRGVTLYMLLLAIYTVLLSRYSGQEDIVVGTPIAGRPHADLERIVGMFVNTLAMRNFPVFDKTFSQFLDEVKKNALAAYENQDYQFETLVERLGLQRDRSRSLLFDTMFVVQNTGMTSEIPVGSMESSPIPSLPQPGEENRLDFQVYDFEEDITQFDIILHANEDSDGISFMMRYCTKLFTQESMDRFVMHLEEIAAAVAADETIQLKDISITRSIENTEIEAPDIDFSF